jgi:hypothetical protein
MSRASAHTCRSAGTRPTLELALSVRGTGSNSAVGLPPLTASLHPFASACARAAHSFRRHTVNDEASEVTNIFLSRKRQASERRGERSEGRRKGQLQDQPAPYPSRPPDIEHHPQRAP